MTKSIEYQYNQVKSFKINLHQKNTLQKLKHKYKIDISQFIRLAIQEKIKRDYSLLIKNINKSDNPF